MPGHGVRIACVLFCFSEFALAQQPDYLPLQVGNQWVYRSQQRGQPLVMEVLKSGVFDGNTYYLTRNFLNSDAWLRTRDGGTLVSYDPNTKQESELAIFGADEGAAYTTSIDPCNSVARVGSRHAVAQAPIGQFDNALSIDYSPPKCADAGLVSESYLPSIGLVERTRETIAGPRTYALSYARIAGILVISAPEVTFSVTLDSAVYTRSAPQPMARLTLRVVQSGPLSLTFPTSQEFDVVVRNAAGAVVYRWSDRQAFAQSFHTLSVGPGEKNYAVQFQLMDAQGNAFPEGSYTLEASLTTAGAQPYRAQVAFAIQ